MSVCLSVCSNYTDVGWLFAGRRAIGPVTEAWRALAVVLRATITSLAHLYAHPRSRRRCTSLIHTVGLQQPIHSDDLSVVDRVNVVHSLNTTLQHSSLGKSIDRSSFFLLCQCPRTRSRCARLLTLRLLRLHFSRPDIQQ